MGVDGGVGGERSGGGGRRGGFYVPKTKHPHYEGGVKRNVEKFNPTGFTHKRICFYHVTDDDEFCKIYDAIIMKMSEAGDVPAGTPAPSSPPPIRVIRVSRVKNPQEESSLFCVIGNKSFPGFKPLFEHNYHAGSEILNFTRRPLPGKTPPPTHNPPHTIRLPSRGGGDRKGKSKIYFFFNFPRKIRHFSTEITKTRLIDLAVGLFFTTEQFPRIIFIPFSSSHPHPHLQLSESDFKS